MVAARLQSDCRLILVIFLRNEPFAVTELWRCAQERHRKNLGKRADLSIAAVALPAFRLRLRASATIRRVSSSGIVALFDPASRVSADVALVAARGDQLASRCFPFRHGNTSKPLKSAS
jgi:hypothetical protein